jgi:ribulose kinase
MAKNLVKNCNFTGVKIDTSQEEVANYIEAVRVHSITLLNIARMFNGSGVKVKSMLKIGGDDGN